MKNCLRWTIVVVIVLCGTLSWGNSPEDPFKTWGEPVGGLQVAVLPLQAADQKESNPQFFIAFKNTGSKDMMLNLGTMDTDESQYHLTRVGITLSAAQGENDELEFKIPAEDKRQGNKDYLVPLPVGAKYFIRIDLAQFWCPKTMEKSLKLKPGNYTIVIAYHAGTQEMPAGVVQSQKLEFNIP